MNGTDSKKAIQPMVQLDDSFVVDQSFTQPDRQSIIEPSQYYHLFNLVNTDKNNDTPKSNSMLNDVAQDNMGPYELESNRSSVLFERSQTHRDKQSETKSNNKEDVIKITSLKNLLRLFRVNLDDNDTFQLNGQKFLIDFDESYCSGSSPAHHKQIYQQQDTKSMPRHEEDYFSPVKFNNNDTKQYPHQIGINSQAQADLYGQGSKRSIQANVDFQDIHLFQSSQVKDNKQDLMNSYLISQDNTPVTSHQVSMKKCETYDREVQVDEKLIEQSIEVVTSVNVESHTIITTTQQAIVEPEEIKQAQAEPVDNFYADIARQLALEIELEELEDELNEDQNDNKAQQQKLEQERIEKERLEYQGKLNQNQGGHHKVRSDILDTKPNANKLSGNFGQNLSPLTDNRDSIAQSIDSADNPKLKRFMSMGDSKDYKFNRNAQLHQMNSKNQELQEQLNAAKQQLENLGQVYIGKTGDRVIADAPLHLAFLFASPLVMRQSGSKGQNSSDNFTTIPLLEFGKEFKEIRESIQETKRVIRIRAKQATIENLSHILAQNPLSVHFSGHGLENSKENFGRQYKQRQSDGNYLLFESLDGEGELVSEKMLQEFIQSSNTKLEFVFVASCYSEFAGKIFLNAGAKHVICVRSGEQIADQAVITFSKSFYNSVFSQTMTICDAFKMAQKQVQVKFGLQESNKFSILINDTSSPDSKSKPKLNTLFNSQASNLSENSSQNHKCKVFGPLKQGDSEFLDIKPRFKEYPSKVDNFVGRQKEIFEVVHNVLNNRLVTLIGLPGIGKTSLCKNAVHYIVDRKIFKQGVIFMSLKGYISFEVFMKKLVVNFVMQNFELDQDKKKEVLDSNIEQLLSLSLHYLKSQEDNLLLVFDNVEDLLYHDKKAFRIFINDLLIQVQNVHILMTSRTTLGTLQDIQEKILVLQELSPFYTVELFVQRSRELKEDEINDLLAYQPENQLLVGDMSYHKCQNVKSLAEHHLFKIFGGNPHAITLAAPLLIRMKLKDLYMLLNTKEMYDVLKVDGIEDSTVASLRLSLEVSIKVLQQEDLQALQFFFLIGMLPGGIEEEELAELWGIDYKKHLDLLMNLSLIQKKETKGTDKVKIMLPPFMSNYADAKIQQEDKILFQNDICHYYAKICKKIYQNNGKSVKRVDSRTSELNHQVMEKLLKHETNIYACIYRMVDIKPQTKTEKDLEESDIDEDQLQDPLQNQQSQRLRRLSTLMQQIEINDDFKKSQTFTTKAAQIQDLSKQETKFFTNKRELGDTIDVKPFSIMTSQTPRTDQAKNFMFPMENEQKQSVSLLQPKTKVIDEEDESDYSDLSNEDNESQEVVNKTKKRPQLDVSFCNNQQDTLDHIIRNSVVNFQRQSFNPNFSQLMQMIKSPDIEKKSLLRRQTLGRNDIHNGLKQIQSFNKKKIKIEELHAAEQLIIYYAMNLFLLHENDSAINMINELALKANGSKLYEANIHRVLGLIYHNKTEIEIALESFKKAKKLYKQANSQYGVALSKFSIGYIYRSKIAEFIIKLDEDVILKRSKVNFESALVIFTQLNHIVGQALCHQQLSFINKSLNQKKDSAEHAKQHQKLMMIYTKHINKRDCPFISRVHGNEISLMSEIVLDNEIKNMFPINNTTSNRRKTVKQSDNEFSDLQMPTEQTQLNYSTSVQVLPNEDIVPPQLKGQESMYIQETDYSPMGKQYDIDVDNYVNIEVAQEEVSLFKDNKKTKPPHSMKKSSPNISPSVTPSPQTPNLITDETSVDSIQSVIQDKTISSQNNLVIKQQSIHLTSKLKKMISTLDIVEEEDESLRPSVVITVESQRQSQIFSKKTSFDDVQLYPEQQIPTGNLKSLSSSVSFSSSMSRKKSFDTNQDKQEDNAQLLELNEKQKAHVKLNNSANKIKKTTPKKMLSSAAIKPQKKL